jgi:hypothetical protein
MLWCPSHLTIHHGGRGGQEEKSCLISTLDDARGALSEVEGQELNLRVPRVLRGSFQVKVKLLVPAASVATPGVFGVATARGRLTE